MFVLFLVCFKQALTESGPPVRHYQNSNQSSDVEFSEAFNQLPVPPEGPPL